MPEEVVLFGIATRYVYDVVESLERAGVSISALVHNLPDVAPPGDLGPIVEPEALTSAQRALGVAYPLVTPGYRKRLEAQGRAMGLERLYTLIDPTALLPRRLTHGEGLQVNAGAIVGAGCTFGRQVQLNRGANIGHDVVAGDYVSFGPGCTLCGSCEIGAGTFVGAGSTLTPGVRVGANAIVGAGAVVVKDVPEHSVVAGNPARIIRTGIPGYNDCSV